ncbi:MAG TPA: outer membrane beta-barrel domain-containing protein [Kofleriaceae bacterium]|nr:outer membrane beta-barrel domain-containing protein [Kofleriaceae bacterium]
MRAFHRSLVLVVGMALAAQPALAQPKKGAPAGKKAGDPKKGGGDKSAPKGGGDEIEMEGDDKSGGGQVDPNEIDMGAPEDKPPADLTADLNAADPNAGVVKAGPLKRTPLSWKDILVVVRKPFLKSRRTELYPFAGTTMNDNMIRHYALGGELAYYLTDVLAVGVEGIYYQAGFREPFDLVARQARRLPTVNQYNWSAALNFHYVPVYGKFALLDRRLVTWEIAFTAGIGAGQSEVIPRDTKFPGFTNLLIQPNIGASMRFFITKWLTVNAGMRDYIFYDKFEPTDRAVGMNETAAEAKAEADGALINNVMFQIGVSFWLPTSFEYTTFR